MREIIQKPIRCRQVFCGASCDKFTADRFGDEPSKCPYYIRNQIIYDKANKEKVRADERTKLIKEIHTNYNTLEPSKFREYLGQLWWNLEE